MARPEHTRTQARTDAGDRCHHLESDSGFLTARVIRLGCWRSGVAAQAATIHSLVLPQQSAILKLLYFLCGGRQVLCCSCQCFFPFLVLIREFSLSPKHMQTDATMLILHTGACYCSLTGVFIWYVHDTVRYKDWLNKKNLYIQHYYTKKE